jgi:hypothetical protein
MLSLAMLVAEILHGQSPGGALDYKFAAMSGDEDYGRAVDFLSTLAVNP